MSPRASDMQKRASSLLGETGRDICFEAGEIHRSQALAGIEGAGHFSEQKEPQKVLDQDLHPVLL